jgi:hypothetical protein
LTCRYSAELQSAIYRRLSQDATLAAALGPAVLDAPIPEAGGFEREYVTIGDEVVKPFGSMTSTGAIHDFDVTVYSGREGFDGAKRIAGSICEALVGAPLDIESGHVVDVRFLRSKAVRGRSPVRRTIALRFRAVVDGV